MLLTQKHTSRQISDFLTTLRSIVNVTCKAYQTDLAIDVETLLLSDLPEKVCWSCGEHGTHFIIDDEYFDAVKVNYGETAVYILNLEKLTVTEAAWDDITRDVLPKYQRN